MGDSPNEHENLLNADESNINYVNQHANEVPVSKWQSFRTHYWNRRYVPLI
jgi:hypothetical protein